MALKTIKNDLINKFVQEVLTQNPSHERFLKTSFDMIKPTSIRSLQSYLEYCISRDLDIEYLARSYNTITIDMQIEQIYFRRNNKYRCSTFAEVADIVYFDDDYMRKYMYGLAITSFLWPSHASIHEFFVKTLPKNLNGSYLEVGPGHGYYFLEALRLCNFKKMIGVDISKTSINLTRDIIEYMQVDNKQDYELIEADFLDLKDNDANYACIVTGEVLEHVEKPKLFLEKISSLSSVNTHIYLTTCVNAPAKDHIYLFRHPSEVEKMAFNCGLSIIDKFYAPYPGLSYEQSMSETLPVNIAYIMKKR